MHEQVGRRSISPASAGPNRVARVALLHMNGKIFDTNVSELQKQHHMQNCSNIGIFAHISLKYGKLNNTSNQNPRSLKGVKLLLEHKASVHKRDECGQVTPSALIGLS